MNVVAQGNDSAIPEPDGDWCIESSSQEGKKFRRSLNLPRFVCFCPEHATLPNEPIDQIVPSWIEGSGTGTRGRINKLNRLPPDKKHLRKSLRLAYRTAAAQLSSPSSGSSDRRFATGTDCSRRIRIRRELSCTGYLWTHRTSQNNDCRCSTTLALLGKLRRIPQLW